MKASPIIEEIEVLQDTVEVSYYYPGDKEATTKPISHEDIHRFSVENGYTELQGEEHCPLRGTREWVERFGPEDITNDIFLRDHLALIVKNYLPQLLTQLEKAA